MAPAAGDHVAVGEEREGLECGVAVQAARLATAEHDFGERRVAHQMLRGRVGIERLEHDLARRLETPRGRFGAFLARRSAR